MLRFVRRCIAGLIRSHTRASAPIVGSVLVVGLAVIVATMVGTVMLGIGSTPDPAPHAAVDLSVEDNTLRFTHQSGETLDVEELSVRISVDGEPLAKQPPVPFFSSAGFTPPTGPFHAKSGSEWEVGETTSLTVAGTNSPHIEAGSTVSVRLFVDESAVIETETTV